MSKIDDLEERIMTLERIVNNLKKEVLGENEEEEFVHHFNTKTEPRYVNKFVTQPGGTMKFERVKVDEGS